MNIDSFVGKTVTHKSFGEGTITRAGNGSVSVKFNSQQDEKKFVFPSCFKGFLTLNADDAALLFPAIETREKEDGEQREREQQKKLAQVERRRPEHVEKKRGKDKKTSPSLRIFENLSSFCDEYERQLITEMKYLRIHGGKRQRISDGRLIEKKKGGRFLYSFESDAELNYPDGTQITLWASSEGISGSIVCCEEYTVIIAASISLGDRLSSIEFTAEDWRLIEFLLNRLQKMKEEPPSSIVQKLVCEGMKNIQYGTALATGQETACKMALSQPITFIWGPPGTGKTETLAKIALQHIQKGNRVLMLSYSNVSVDGAILRVHNRDTNKQAGRLLRYGYPRDKSLLAHEYLTSYNLIIQRYTDLLSERTQLISERNKLTSAQKATPRYVEIQTRLSQIRKRLMDEEKTAVQSARFVATTVSKAVADKTIYEDDFDVVIFDEASMAYIPQIVFSAGLANKHFICIGDFAQLPPIVQNSSDSILNADIFHYCGISDAVKQKCGHNWLCLLNTQYRMHPQIADFASATMYHNLLRSAKGMTQNRFSITHSTPLVDFALGLVDLSGMMSVCSKTADKSRINPLSAFVALGLALKGAENNEVGIITPYHAQSKLLYAMAHDIGEQNPSLHPITCATVHQFQGSEKDVVIYDIVDCYRQRYPGALLTSTNNDYANRLFNVALTRAKGKFIAVANISYLDNKGFSQDLMFAKLISEYRYKKQSLHGSALDSEFKDVRNAGCSWFQPEHGTNLFIKDITDAKSEVRIEIPGKMNCSEKSVKQLATLLHSIKSKGVKLIIRAEQKSNLPEALRQFAIQNSYVANPISIIDKKVVWFGEPLSGANFVSEGHIIQTQYRPIIRFVGRRTAVALYGFLEMNQTIDQPDDLTDGDDSSDTFAQYVASHCSCSSCGKPMKLKRKKSFFLGCSGYPDCKNTELISPDLVEEYFYEKSKVGKLCPQCKTSLEAKLGQYGIYIQCCGLSRHRYRLDEI